MTLTVLLVCTRVGVCLHLPLEIPAIRQCLPQFLQEDAGEQGVFVLLPDLQA